MAQQDDDAGFAKPIELAEIEGEDAYLPCVEAIAMSAARGMPCVVVFFEEDGAMRVRSVDLDAKAIVELCNDVIENMGNIRTH